MRYIVYGLTWLLLLVLLAGCGGGGGSSSGGSQGTLGVFVTDDPRTDYSHIWVKIFKIELTGAGGSEVVYEDSLGKVIDLRTLRDGQGERFAFLGSRTIDVADYTGATVTMSKDLALVPTGGNASVPMTFHGNFDAGPGKSSVSFAIQQGGQLGSGVPRLVVDFDLPVWQIVGSVVTPALRRGGTNGMDDSLRHEAEDYHGVIGGLAGIAPNQTFTLATLGGSFKVSTSDGTLVYNDNGNPGPALANGQLVEVRGTFSTTSNSLQATSIKIEDGPGQGEAEIKGAISDVNEPQGTFRVATTLVENFLPGETTVTVLVTGATTYRNARGATITRAEFFALLLGGTVQYAEAEGTYDSATNTLTATKAKVEDDAGGGGGDADVEVHGSVTTFNGPAGTLSIRLTTWMGFSGSVGMIVPVQTDGGTAFLDDQGNPLTALQFFGALQVGGLAEVEGHWNGQTLTATKAKLDDN